MSRAPTGPEDTCPATDGTRRTDAWGRVVVHADDLLDLLYNDCDPAGLLVRPDAVIDGYNRWCTTFDKRDSLIPPLSSPSVTPAAMHADRARHWLMPPAFRDLDVRALLLPRCPDAAARARLNREMDLFAARDLLGLLQLMCALVDYFRRDGIVWGVGRGSSCASYALFLIGVHKVDALQYDLDIGEFLHD